MARGYDDYDEYDDDYDDRPPPRLRPPFPVSVLTAGVIWLVNGGLILASGLLVLVVTFAFAGDGRLPNAREAGNIVVGFVCFYAVVALFGGAFVFVGIQSVRGTTHDTLGNGIGSLIFAAIGYAVLLVSFNQNATIIGVLIQSIGATGLLVAGILALVGREQYRLWKYGDRPPRPRPRRRRPPLPDAYYDDDF